MPRPSDDQHRLAESLERLGMDAAASFYRDGCRMMVDPQGFETTSHLVSHALRETESAIRKSLIGFIGAPPLESPHEEEAVHLLATIEKSPRSRFYRRVVQVARTADERTRKGTHRAEIERIVRVTGASDDLAQAWLRLTGFTRDEDGRPTRGLHARAHRSQLGRPRAVGDEFEAVWRQAEVFLRKVVAHLEARFDLVLVEVERLLAVDAATREDAGLLVASALRSPPALTQFLDRLSGPLWVAQLIKVGLFARPTGRVRDEDEGSTWYPVWPPSRFIRRIAGDEAWHDDVVAEALLAVPPTNNQRVVGDLVDAAKQLPGALVAEWARTWLAGDVLGALDTSLHFNSFADISELAAHLAREGEARAALDLARALYQLTPPPEPDPEAFWSSTAPRTLASSSFYYRDGLRDDLPVVAAAAPWDVLALLSDQIDAYIRWTTDDAAPDDGSEHWIDDVGEDDDGSSMYETGSWLARALCRTTLGIVAADQAAAVEVVAWLLGRERHVYVRCALVVTREHGTPANVAALLSDRDRLFDEPVQEETVRLIEARLLDLPDEDRGNVLARLEAGPRAGFSAERAQRNEWPEILPEQADEWADEVRRRLLGRLRGALPEAWVASHTALFPSTDAPAPAAPNPSVATLDAINVLLASDPEAGLRRLAHWDTIEHPPSIEAAAFSLERAVRADRAGFAAVADALIGADATMVHRFVSGLGEREDAADDAVGDVEWEPVLRLMAWAVRQPREIAGRTLRERDGDPHWGWARKRIARVLDRALRGNALPWPLRDLVWDVLSPITDDPDPEAAEEAGRSGALNHAINTTRGDAVSAVFGFVLWAHWATEDARNEVQDAFGVLDAHLDSEVDGSPAIRAVYGQNIPLLMGVAAPWIQERVGLLFPEDEALRLGTWDGYGYTQRRAQDVIELLTPAYLAELDRIGENDVFEVRHPDDPFLRQNQVRGVVRRWAVQIADAYLLGSVGLEEGDLGAALFGHPVAAVRALAVQQVGRLLRESWANHAPGVIGERVVAAWEWQRALFDLTADVGEAFSAWPPVDGIDVAWSLPHLVDALAASRGEAQSGHRIIEWLATVCSADPARAVRILDLLVQSERGNLYVLGQEAEMRAVLKTAARAGGEAREGAQQAANRILLRSHIDLSDALVDPESDGD